MLWDVLTGARFDVHAALGAEYAGHRSYLHDIDAEGNVLGTVYGTFLGDERDFVLRPLAAAAVPEPGTAPLLGLAGLIGLAAFGRGPLRRKQARTRMDTCTPP
jgi:hypothetical protein